MFVRHAERNRAQISQLPCYAFRLGNLLLCPLHGSPKGKKGPYFGGLKFSHLCPSLACADLAAVPGQGGRASEQAAPPCPAPLLVQPSITPGEICRDVLQAGSVVTPQTLAAAQLNLGLGSACSPHLLHGGSSHGPPKAPPMPGRSKKCWDQIPRFPPALADLELSTGQLRDVITTCTPFNFTSVEKRRAEQTFPNPRPIPGQAGKCWKLWLSCR